MELRKPIAPKQADRWRALEAAAEKAAQMYRSYGAAIVDGLGDDVPPDAPMALVGSELVFTLPDPPPDIPAPDA